MFNIKKRVLLKWKWTDGVQFQVVAPLSSMANNIGGNTMHTWAGLKFTNSEGVQISGDMLKKDKDNISLRHVKCAKLRFLFRRSGIWMEQITVTCHC